MPWSHLTPISRTARCLLHAAPLESLTRHSKPHPCHTPSQLVEPRSHLISIFNDHELELLISGLPDIDVADLRANTEYNGFTPTAPVIRCVRLTAFDPV